MSARRFFALRLLAAAVGLAGLAACGYKADLYLPPPPPPAENLTQPPPAATPTPDTNTAPVNTIRGK